MSWLLETAQTPAELGWQLVLLGSIFALVWFTLLTISYLNWRKGWPK
jgi:hypothetical protein